MEKELCAEWRPFMKEYRLYDPKHPQETVDYAVDLDKAETIAKENGYDTVVRCDADTMHIELI